MTVTFVWHFNDSASGLPVPGITVHDVWATGQATTTSGANGVCPAIVFPTDTPIALTITVPGLGSYSNPAVGVDSQFDGQQIDAIVLVDRAGSQLLQQDGLKLPLTGGGGGGDGNPPSQGNGTALLVGAGLLAAAWFVAAA